jgi:tRNA(Ile)-lysidine synthase
VWHDSSNHDPHFSRNRIRAEVLPVLDALHPGASRRLSALGERWEQEEAAERELQHLALSGLLLPAAAGSPGPGLDRRGLIALAPANRRRLLQHWLTLLGQPLLAAEPLEALLQRLAPERGPGQQQLPNGQLLHWDRQGLWLALAERQV